MEVNTIYINEVLLTQDEELTKDDLIQLEAFRNSEENNMPIESTTPDVKKFTAKRLEQAFNLIDMTLQN